MLILKMNCILYSSLVMKYNQISQNVDTNSHCQITRTHFFISLRKAKQTQLFLVFNPSLPSNIIIILYNHM